MDKIKATVLTGGQRVDIADAIKIIKIYSKLYLVIGTNEYLNFKVHASYTSKKVFQAVEG